MEDRFSAHRIRSYAKVNLCLDVLDKRPDGFHDIESVMQTISLHDTVTLSVTDVPGIRISCDMPGIPLDGRNLAYKAAAVFFEKIGYASGLDICIGKRIPPEAGLGGGSGNAAAVLRGLSDLLKPGLSDSDLCDLASLVGSDAPFFLVGGTALVQGRGEIIRPLPDIAHWWVVVVKPSFGVSTPWAYRRLDEMRLAGSGQQSAVSHSSELVRCILEEGCRGLAKLIWNDLQGPAIEEHPEILEIKDMLVEAGARASLMCGSGSAVFGLFEDEVLAREAAPSLVSRGTVFVERTVSSRQ